jgi:hypothetical protein
MAALSQRRGVENLLATQMLALYDQSRLPIDAGSVTTTLARMHVAKAETHEEREQVLAAQSRRFVAPKTGQAARGARGAAEATPPRLTSRLVDADHVGR